MTPLPGFFNALSLAALKEFSEEEQHFRAYGFKILSDQSYRKVQQLLGVKQLDISVNESLQLGKSLRENAEDVASRLAAGASDMQVGESPGRSLLKATDSADDLRMNSGKMKEVQLISDAGSGVNSRPQTAKNRDLNVPLDVQDIRD